MTPSRPEFLDHLREEKIRAQQTRFDIGFAAWLAGTCTATWLLYALYLRRRTAVDQSKVPVGRGVGERDPDRQESSADLPAEWRDIRQIVKDADYTLNREIFEKARAIFIRTYAAGAKSPADVTREYAKKEYLLALDEHGLAVRLPADVLERFNQTVDDQPRFAEWFRKDRLPGGEPVLLAARWLCHLIGLLHDTVEIFIDPPDLPGYTLVQVRGMDKFEAPGAFDIPCAGHISGVETAEEALCKELAEELNLTLDDLDGLHLLSRYNSIQPDNSNGSINNEHRILYRARLKPAAAGRIRFADGEVAGLGVMNMAELCVLVDRYPGRVASGLSGAVGYYE